LAFHFHSIATLFINPSVKFNLIKLHPLYAAFQFKSNAKGINSIKLSNDQPGGKVPQVYRGVKIKINKQTNFSTLKLKTLLIRALYIREGISSWN
jgi:hypothetical protein